MQIGDLIRRVPSTKESQHSPRGSIVSLTYCGDHPTIYTNMESLLHTAETSNVTCQLYHNF